MRVLYISLSYDKAGDNLYNNLVDCLIERGHHITIMRSNDQNNSLERITELYDILNVKTGNPFDKNIFRKGINQLMMQFYFKRAVKKFLSKNKYDLIIYATPPITFYSVIKYCKHKYHATTYLMLKDIFPQNAVDLEMFTKKNIIYQYFRIQERNYYNISDFIGCMSEGNMKYLINQNPYINSDKVGIFPNSINITSHNKTVFNDDYTLFVFGGNIGKPQNILFILDVFKSLENYSKAKLLLIGSGTEEDKIKEFIKSNNLKNVTYKNNLPPLEYEQVVANSDVGLISLDYRFTIPNIPSKFQSYLKQGKPVLAITDTHTDIKDMILENDCGWWCPSNDEQVVINMIKEICSNKTEQILKGNNAYNYLVKDFNIIDCVEKIEYFVYKRTKRL